MAPGLVDDAATQHGARGARRRPGGPRSVGEARRRAVRHRRPRLERGGARRRDRRDLDGRSRRRDARRAVHLDGRFVGDALRERVIAFDARRLGRVPVGIAVASGESKVRPILGALRSGVVRTLVTDVATAEAVVALDDAGPR